MAAYSNDYGFLTPQELSAAVNARREMMNHLSQRVQHQPSAKAMKLYQQQGARRVWSDLLRADRQPRRTLYMPGRKGAA